MKKDSFKGFLNLKTKKEIQKIMDLKNVSENQAIAEIVNLYAKNYLHLIESSNRAVENFLK